MAEAPACEAPSLSPACLPPPSQDSNTSAYR
jgi:hypothetical protein